MAAPACSESIRRDLATATVHSCKDYFPLDQADHARHPTKVVLHGNVMPAGRPPGSLNKKTLEAPQVVEDPADDEVIFPWGLDSDRDDVGVAGDPVIELAPEPPTPPVTDPSVIARDIESRRRRMKSIGHLFDHYPAIPGCPDCDAKARGKRHERGSFDCDDPQYAKYVTTSFIFHPHIQSVFSRNVGLSCP